MALNPADICDGTSVGVIIARGDRYLLGRRLKFPPGVAPVAGHVDQWGSSRAAADAEAREEAGLTLVDLTQIDAGWMPNTCRRVVPRSRKPGHQWTIFTAVAGVNIGISKPDEMARLRWYSTAEINELARRTVAWAGGRISNESWQAVPGLEPVWAHWLQRAGILHLTRSEWLSLSLLPAGTGGGITPNSQP